MVYCLGDILAKQLEYIIFDTDMGWVGILGSARGLLGATLPQRSAQEVRQLLGDSISCAIRSPRLFGDLMERLRIYFSGCKAAFPDELDLSRATAFQREVWGVVRLIPYGKTKSYSWVAKQVGKPSVVRAVGQALARNPLPVIVPCHRVVTNSGKLGGYSGGVEMKRKLLQLEVAVK